MSREFDRREALAADRATPDRERHLTAAAQELSEALPEGQEVSILRLDGLTGNPAELRAVGAEAGDGDLVSRALAAAVSNKPALGFAAAQAAEFVPDPAVQETSSGATAVHLQQTYKGIPIYDAAPTVQFSHEGAFTAIVGPAVTVSGDVAVEPAISVHDAVSRAAAYVASDGEVERDQFGEPLGASVDVGSFEPAVLAAFGGHPDRPTVLEAGPFGKPILASLLWFPLDELRLAWEVILTIGEYDRQYRVLVDAADGELLLCKQLVATVAARGNVYVADGGGGRQMVDFPGSVARYGVPVPPGLPAGFPDTWVEASSATGNNVNAHLGDGGPTIPGTVSGGVVTFSPADPTGDDQKVLNIFYFNNVLHDVFYLLGFREKDGNFQRDSLGRGGAGSDRVDARSYPGAVTGTASMATPVDGQSPVMRMGVVTSTTRHTAFDSTVVFHEFMHGVTNRLVGGPMNVRALDAPQSGGMGEGWGDYVACTLNQRDVVGTWVVNNPAGIRRFRYDSAFPDSFANLGTGRYTEVHNIGEVWCATLMEMNRNVGAMLAFQLVVDALKLAPANPSFLDMRDAIISALEHKRAAGDLSAAAAAAALAGIWKAFAKFGMGPGAQSNGAFLSGIHADFSVPAVEPAGGAVRLEAHPAQAIPDNAAGGVSSALSVIQNGAVEEIAVAVDITHPWIGDLRVTLRPPNAAPVVLHDRKGGGSDNIVTRYTPAEVPGFGAVVGSQAHGDWFLDVVDAARRDVGTFNAWTLELQLEGADEHPTVRGSSQASRTIPDDDPEGIVDTIHVTQNGTVRSIAVSVDITHSYVGDLSLELVSADGTTVMLRDRHGRGDDQILETYDPTSVEELGALAGEAVAGDWRLRVRDHEGQEVGKLNLWSIEIGV
jgi:extracellular elastinolytic metalloproteinase